MFISFFIVDFPVQLLNSDDLNGSVGGSNCYKRKDYIIKYIFKIVIIPLRSTK